MFSKRITDPVSRFCISHDTTAMEARTHYVLWVPRRNDCLHEELKSFVVRTSNAPEVVPIASGRCRRINAKLLSLNVRE